MSTIETKDPNAWFDGEPFGAFWEKGYRDMKVSTMGVPNHDIVELAAALPAGARVLDLGCGEGRNAFFLAGKGFDVTAVDRSASGISKLAFLANEAGYSMNTIVADISELEISGGYDLVMAHGVIDYLSNAQWRRLLTSIKAHTNPGGFNAYTCMIFSEEYPAPPEFRAAHFLHSVAPGELGEFYRDWDTVRYDHYVKWDQHPGIPIHRHPLEKLVSRKPSGHAATHVTEPVPVGSVDMPRERFDQIPMGMLVTELVDLCGEPDVVDTITTDGVQLGVSNITADGYCLSLWFYGKTVIYVIRDRVWGRALYLSGRPVRVRF